MTTVNDLLNYLQHMQLIGLGQCRVGLCRRGLDVSHDVLSLTVPVDGERVSDDGRTVYLSARRVEFQGESA